MKYNLEKEIKQQMKYCEGNEEETSVIFEYPDPAETEFVGSCNFCGVVV